MYCDFASKCETECNGRTVMYCFVLAEENVLVVSGCTVKCGPWQIEICIWMSLDAHIKCGPWLIEIF